MSRPYRPSNGTEGMAFMAAYCGRCKRDQEYQRTQENGCSITVLSMAHYPEDPEYPPEWIEEDDE